MSLIGTFSGPDLNEGTEGHKRLNGLLGPGSAAVGRHVTVTRPLLPDAIQDELQETTQGREIVVIVIILIILIIIIIYD